MKPIETYTENKYIKTTFNKGIAETWVYPYDLIDKEKDLISVLIAKGVLFSEFRDIKKKDLINIHANAVNHFLEEEGKKQDGN